MIQPLPARLNATQTARLLNVHRRTVDREIARGRLHRDPQTKTFARDAVEALLEQRYARTRERLIQKLLRAAFPPAPPVSDDDLDGWPF
ncbi:helix-turn-helix domain-containing protein [Deinococcus sp. NW-56]|uniref:helix-turn-helix domain-containing protein n=1 Tax=Deinococcus sp. NW-56 TaxID=2080419 RepID=UPI001319DD08|nr:helix-turn-helix domain-containing protein [Deinococcus sp. NW-56]